MNRREKLTNLYNKYSKSPIGVMQTAKVIKNPTEGVVIVYKGIKIGIARKDPADEWDEEIGITIATMRMNGESEATVDAYVKKVFVKTLDWTKLAKDTPIVLPGGSVRYFSNIGADGYPYYFTYGATSITAENNGAKIKVSNPKNPKYKLYEGKK